MLVSIVATSKWIPLNVIVRIAGVLLDSLGSDDACIYAWVNWIIFVSGNSLMPLGKAITWTCDDLPLTGPIRNKLQNCSCTKIHLKMSSTKCLSIFCWWHFQMDFQLSVDILLRPECVRTIGLLPPDEVISLTLVHLGLYHQVIRCLICYHWFLWSHEIVYWIYWVAPKFDWHLSNSASVIPIKFQRD